MRPGVALVWGLALAVLLPVLVVVFRAMQPDDFWAQLVERRLGGYLWTTGLLTALVTVVAVLMGAPAAWYVTVHDFPGRRLFEWLLMMPLAVPGFIAAMAYVDALHQITPVYISIRQQFGIDAFLLAQKITPWIFAVTVLSSTLFPYVYLSCRAYFIREGAGPLEAARTLGAGGGRVFRLVALPMARPAVVAGASLVLMETINDVGVVTYFGLSTLTPGIFRSWMEGHPGSAMRLAMILIGFTLLALALEKWLRGRRRYSGAGGAAEAPLARIKLNAWGTARAWMVCGIPLALGFGIPVWRLVRWALQTWGEMKWRESLPALWNSLWLSVAAAALIVVAGGILAGADRAFPHRGVGLARRIGSLGYTMPSALVAVGVGAAVSWLAGLHSSLGFFALSASATGLIFAYFVRFLAVAIQPASAGLERAGPELHDAARTLGHKPLAAFWRVDLPLIRPALIVGAALAFLDVFKELTLTLVLRPFNFETLSTRVFRLTDESRIPEAALPALALIFCSLIGLIPLTRFLGRLAAKPSPAEASRPPDSGKS